MGKSQGVYTSSEEIAPIMKNLRIDEYFGWVKKIEKQISGKYLDNGENIEYRNIFTLEERGKYYIMEIKRVALNGDFEKPIDLIGPIKKKMYPKIY